MTPEERAAHVAEMIQDEGWVPEDRIPTVRRWIERHILEAVADEREACAKIADYTLKSAEMSLAEGGQFDGDQAADAIADDIRRRSKKE